MYACPWTVLSNSEDCGLLIREVAFLHLIEAGNDDTEGNSPFQLLRATVYHRIEDCHCALQHGQWEDQEAVVTVRFA